MSVIFDQLKISDDGNRMYINAHVNKAEYFKDMSIESVIIMTSDQVSESSFSPSIKNSIWHKTFDDLPREVNIVLTPSNFEEVPTEGTESKFKNMSKDLFFVFITCKGTPGECTPCRLDEYFTLGVVFDENILYQKAMGYTKELIDDCKVHGGFIDFILLWNAFKAAIETEHYTAAIRFYNMMFGDKELIRDIGLIKSCGCNG